MLLDIAVALNEAKLALDATRALDHVRCARLRDALIRDARIPSVMGNQRAAALDLAQQLAARLDGQAP